MNFSPVLPVRMLTASLACLFVTSGLHSAPGLISPASAHNPVDYLEAISLVAGAPIEHGVELECGDAFPRQMVDLEGPQFLCTSVGALGKAAPKSKIWLTGYRVVQPKKGTTLTVKVLDFVRQGDSTELRISSTPEFFLSPAQQLAAGQPDPVPEGLDRYLAFKVVEAEKMQREIELTGNATELSQRQLGRPLFVCLPAEEWHHDEHFEVTHRLSCFVIYQLDEASVAENEKLVNTLDQFGLNQLTLKNGQWLVVRGALLKQ